MGEDCRFTREAGSCDDVRRGREKLATDLMNSMEKKVNKDEIYSILQALMLPLLLAFSADHEGIQFLTAGEYESLGVDQCQRVFWQPLQTCIIFSNQK